jgi:hypothetical protein
MERSLLNLKFRDFTYSAKARVEKRLSTRYELKNKPTFPLAVTIDICSGQVILDIG